MYGGCIEITMDVNDWFSFFSASPVMSPEESAAIWARDRAFFDLVKTALGDGEFILEAGCGPGKRMLAFQHIQRVHLLMCDRDPRILRMCRANFIAMNASNVTFLGQDFLEQSFAEAVEHVDLITHHGVLEHYEPTEIRDALRVQLGMCADVVFAVPVKTTFNEEFFASDTIRRNLWTVDEWRNGVLAELDIVSCDYVHTNKDEINVHVRS